MTKSKGVKAVCKKHMLSPEDGGWNRRTYLRLKEHFSSLNPAREDVRRQRKANLNAAQRQYLIQHFVRVEGGFKDLCKKCLMEFAGVSNSVIASLRSQAKTQSSLSEDRLVPCQETRGAPGHPPAVINNAVAWMIASSYPDPKDRGLRFFPSHFPSYRRIYQDFEKTHPKGTEFWISRTKWMQIRKVRCPKITRQKLSKAACDVCCAFLPKENGYLHWLPHSNNCSVEEANAKLGEFARVWEEQQQHLEYADGEYKNYMKLKEECKAGDHPDLLNLSIDAMELIQLPHFGKSQPKSAHFKRSFPVTPQGVIDETKKRGDILLYDAFSGSTNASHLISVIDSYLGTKYDGEQSRLQVTFDNCTINKNRWMVAYFYYLVHVACFDEIQWSFLVAGHSKYGPDTMFGWFSGTYRKENLYEIEDVAKLTQTSKSYTARVMERNSLLDWKEFLDPHVSAVKGISKYHHMRVRRVDDNELVIEAKNWISDENWKELHVITDPFEFFETPDSLNPLPIVPLTQKKLKDLKTLEKFCNGHSLSYVRSVPTV
eukprot:CAMPEP_0201540170 /NCGR_PEP_ID=MMETSP0161_2-20130828/70800_1 /ASSEMBLY_ACC=CAM_ASM_000251 /TAXON_ID=180227 /ORGANISM="Neoparamoeba aestuarina, Strain SoJaBio B1-5/56/2" /LENGTH=542 /DNA_ID=CAMNT_0047947621 /DNA_START=515 /DNA_END=2143 /DNA_ORIENTATION=-